MTTNISLEDLFNIEQALTRYASWIRARRESLLNLGVSEIAVERDPVLQVVADLSGRILDIDRQWFKILEMLRAGYEVNTDFQVAGKGSE